MKSRVSGQNLLDIVAETSLPWFHYALLPIAEADVPSAYEWNTSENTVVCAGCFAGVIAPR